MASQSQTSNLTASPIANDDEIPIPNNLRFALESLKLLVHTPLTPETYLTWSRQVESTFRANKYSQYLDPTTPIPPPFLISPEGHRTPNPLHPKYTLINESLFSALLSTISLPLHPIILRLQTVADLWTTIKNHLQSQTRSRILQLKAELGSLVMRGTDLNQYLTHARSLYDQLEAAGCHTDDEDMILLILNGLPTYFDSFVAAFRIQNERITLPNFYSLVITEATNIQHRAKLHNPDPHLALTTTHHRPSPVPQRNPNYKGKNPRPYYPSSNTHPNQHKPSTTHRHAQVECQLCKNLGHTVHTCRYRYYPSSSSSSSSHPKTAYQTETLPPPPTYHPSTPHPPPTHNPTPLSYLTPVPPLISQNNS